jgi:hypothetical protein
MVTSLQDRVLTFLPLCRTLRTAIGRRPPTMLCLTLNTRFARYSTKEAPEGVSSASR